MSEKHSHIQRETNPVARHDRLKIRHKLALCFSLLLLITSTAFWLLFQNGLQQTLQQFNDTIGNSLAEQTAISVRELVLTKDLLGLNVVLTQLVRDENILNVTVLDVDDNLLASAGFSATEPSERENIYSVPISVQEAIAGTVQIELDNSLITSSNQQLQNLFWAVLIITLVLAVAIAYALAGHITTPVLALAHNLGSALGNNDKDAHVEPGKSDGFSELNDNADKLLEQFHILEKQLQETGFWQSDEQEYGQEPSRLAASILIVKVVNINTAIELLHPDTLARLLKEYLAYLNKSVLLYGGRICRNTGESVMICFDSAVCNEEHSINAIHCAGLFQLAINKINKIHKSEGGQTLEFRFSIHSGDVFLAPEISGKNDAGNSADAVLGKTIDIAFFLSKQAKPGELIISETTSSQARIFEELETVSQNEVTMPADNVSFMAYILDNGFAIRNELIKKQCKHILQSLNVKDSSKHKGLSQSSD